MGTGDVRSERYGGDKCYMLVQMQYNGDPQTKVVLAAFDVTNGRPDLPFGAAEITYVGANKRLGDLLDKIVEDCRIQGWTKRLTLEELADTVDVYMARDIIISLLITRTQLLQAASGLQLT